MATSVRLEPDIEARLDTLAKQTGRTKAYYIRQIITEHLEDLEDYYLAEAAYERYRRGEERAYSSEEVRKMLGLEDKVS